MAVVAYNETFEFCGSPYLNTGGMQTRPDWPVFFATYGLVWPYLESQMADRYTNQMKT